ncbi:MAG TPA: hypothetical protein VGN22_21395 [Pseudonocardia sp.]
MLESAPARPHDEIFRLVVGIAARDDINRIAHQLDVATVARSSS